MGEDQSKTAVSQAGAEAQEEDECRRPSQTLSQDEGLLGSQEGRLETFES